MPRIDEKKSWGELSGARRYYRERNADIITLFREGKSIEKLAEEFSLSVDSIRKIVYPGQ